MGNKEQKNGPHIVGLTLKLIEKEDGEDLFHVVDDGEVRSYFADFNCTKEEILEGIETLNNNPTNHSHWLLKSDVGTVGYISLKKSISVFDFLNPAPPINYDDPDFSLDLELDLSLEETRKRNKDEYDRKMLLAPYAIDIIIHKDFRAKGVAHEAFLMVCKKALLDGITEIYLEIHKDNKPSLSWAQNKLGAILVGSPDNYFYPSDIFKINLKHLLN